MLTDGNSAGDDEGGFRERLRLGLVSDLLCKHVASAPGELDPDSLSDW